MWMLRKEHQVDRNESRQRLVMNSVPSDEARRHTTENGGKVHNKLIKIIRLRQRERFFVP